MGFYEELKKSLSKKTVDVGEMSRNAVISDDYVKCMQLQLLLEENPGFIDRITGADDASLAEAFCKEAKIFDAKGIPADVYAYILSEIAVASGKTCQRMPWINPLAGDNALSRGYGSTFGTGATVENMSDNAVSGGVFTGCVAARPYIRISYGVRKIGANAAARNGMVRTVYISNSVTDVEKNAFSGCSNLKRVYASPALKQVGEGAFEGASALETVFAPGVQTLGDRAMKGTAISSTTCFPSLKRIGQFAFADCRNLADADISFAESVGKGAFLRCTGIQTLKLGKGSSSPSELLCSAGETLSKAAPGLKTVFYECTDGTIPDNFFGNCDCVENIVITGTVSKIGRHAFNGCKALKEIRMVYTGAEIPAEMFSGCISLETLPLFRYVKRIGERAFEGCAKLKKVNFAGAIEYIGARAFYGCASLEAAYAGAGQIFLVGECGNMAFAGCTSLKYPPVLTETAVLGERCFYGAKNIDTVVASMLPASAFALFPDSVGSIRQVQFLGERVPDGAFSGLSSLQTVRFDSKTGKVMIGKNAFNGDKSLTTVVNSHTVKEIGTCAFSGTSVERLDLSGIEMIEAKAFDGIRKDLTVDIPSSKQSVVDGWDPEWKNTGKRFMFAGARLVVKWL